MPHITEVSTPFYPRLVIGPKSPELDAIRNQVPTEVSAGTRDICTQSERLWIKRLTEATFNPTLFSHRKSGPDPLQLHLLSNVPLYSYDYPTESTSPIIAETNEQIAVDILVRPTPYGKTIAFVYQGPLTGMLAYYPRSQTRHHNGSHDLIANRWFNESANISRLDSPNLLSANPGYTATDALTNIHQTLSEFRHLDPDPSPIQTFTFLLEQLGLPVDHPNLHYTQDHHNNP